MKKVIILKQENCLQCNAEKMFLMGAFRGRHDAVIDNLMREERTEEFEKWVAETHTQQTPTTIFLNEDESIIEVVQGFGPAQAARLKNLFDTHFPE